MRYTVDTMKELEKLMEENKDVLIRLKNNEIKDEWWITEKEKEDLKK